MTDIQKLLKQIIQDNRDVEHNTALLKEYKDRLRNSNFDNVVVKETHDVANVIYLELQKIKSEIEQAIETTAKTRDYTKFKTYTENIARMQAFKLFLQKCELFTNGRIDDVALMNGLENLLKDEIFQERSVEGRISLYQRMMEKSRGIIASTAMIGTLLGGFVAADMIRPKSAYAEETTISESDAKRIKTAEEFHELQTRATKTVNYPDENGPQSIKNVYQRARHEAEGVRIAIERVNSRAYTIKGVDWRKDYASHRDEYVNAFKKDKKLEQKGTYNRLISLMDNSQNKVEAIHTYYAGYMSFNINNQYFIIFEVDESTIKFMVE